MRSFRFILTVVSLNILSLPAFSQVNPKEVVRKADEKMSGESSYAEMTMKIIRPDWEREISMKNWTKGSDYSLILVTGPARDKGTATLKRSKEVWNWQPNINRSIKLPPSMMMQSWMGSDFTNDDLVKESSVVEDYTHKLLGDTVINNKSAWKILMIPKENAPVVWGKIISYIDKEDYNQYMGMYYDEDGKLVNTIIMSDIKNMGGKMIPTRIEMIPADKKGQKTVITYKVLKHNYPVDESFFSMQNMKRVQ
jgi:outer membrane lipoprotein-sorting protein